MRLWLVVLAFVSLAVTAAPQHKVRTECVEVEKPLPWTYCKTTTLGSRNRDLLYHFHGKGLSAKTWTEEDYFTGMVRKEWARHRANPPVVVSISFGPIWLLVEKNASEASGLFEVFTQVIMPTVEKSLTRFSGRRMLVGESMGGFNATQIALKTNRLFAKVAILCPPMVPLSPFASQPEIEKYTAEVKADPELVKEVIEVSRYYMPELADWLKASPMDLARTNLSRRSPEIYLSCGLYDKFGFFPGSEKFAEMGATRGARIHWRPIYGGHCAIDAISLAAFLR